MSGCEGVQRASIPRGPQGLVLGPQEGQMPQGGEGTEGARRGWKVSLVASWNNMILGLVKESINRCIPLTSSQSSFSGCA